MTGTITADEKLTWLIEGLLERTPGARHALVLSRDGLKLCRTPELSVDQADQLAAIAAGIQSLSHGASVEFGDGSGACARRWPSSTEGCCSSWKRATARTSPSSPPRTPTPDWWDTT